MTVDGNKGALSSLTDSMGKGISKILAVPDNFKHPAARKAARIAFDILIIGLGVGIFFMMNKGGFSGLADPSMTTMMSMPLYLGAVGVGLSWLLQDIIGKKHLRTAGKISAILLPMFLAAGIFCVAGAGFSHGFYATSMNTYYFAGLALLPLVFYGINRAIKVCSQSEILHFHCRAPSRRNNTHRRQSTPPPVELQNIDS